MTKSCKKGYYYCYSSQKCKKIPKGYHVMTSGRLMKDDGHENKEETKKNGNNTNGNGDGNGSSDGGSSDGGISEAWSTKYKKSIDCNNPKGFSQKAHCSAKNKTNKKPMKYINEEKTEEIRYCKLCRKMESKNDCSYGPSMWDRYTSSTPILTDNQIKYNTNRPHPANESKDHEYSMARSELSTIVKAAKRLQKKMKKGEGEIEAWVQSKITKAADYIDTAADYVNSGEMNKEEVEMLEGKRDGKSAKDKDYSLRDWFKDGGWVQAGGKYDGKPCAKQPGQKTKPFCRDADDRAAMSKEERNRRAAKKRREDPNPNRSGKAKFVTSEQIDATMYGGPDKLLQKLLPKGEKIIPSSPYKKTEKMSKLQKSHFEMEGQKLDELWGKVAIGAGAAAIPYLLKKFAKPAVDKAIDAPATGSKTLVDKLKQRRDATNKEIQKNSYEPEGELIDEKKDACYSKVKSRYKVWPSAYASGALVKCRKVGAKNWGNKSENFQDYNLKDEYIEENIIRAAKMAKNVIKALGKSKVRKSLPPINLKNLSPERKQEIMYQAQKRIKSYKPGEIDKSASRKYAADRLNTVYSKRQDVLKKGGSPKEAAAQSISSIGPGDPLGKDFNIKRGGRGRRGAHGPQTDRGKGNKSARRVGKEVTDTGNVNVHYRPTRDQSIQRSRERRSMRSMERRLNRMQSDDRKAIKSVETRLNKMLNLNNDYNFSNWREDLYEDWQKVNKSDKTDGMSLAAVKAYRSENPGSKLKTAVTEKNPGPKRSKRRKSFCSRSEGQKNMHNIDCSKTPQKPICKARKRWRC